MTCDHCGEPIIQDAYTWVHVRTGAMRCVLTNPHDMTVAEPAQRDGLDDGD